MNNSTQYVIAKRLAKILRSVKNQSKRHITVGSISFVDLISDDNVAGKMILFDVTSLFYKCSGLTETICLLCDHTENNV